ncbi:MAG: hypothetical protein M3R02_26795 [Chloroflexota bacterium]|nr:hypothetical protein [Chloroflexota bacterium]
MRSHPPTLGLLAATRTRALFSEVNLGRRLALAHFGDAVRHNERELRRALALLIMVLVVVLTLAVAAWAARPVLPPAGSREPGELRGNALTYVVWSS